MLFPSRYDKISSCKKQQTFLKKVGIIYKRSQWWRYDFYVFFKSARKPVPSCFNEHYLTTGWYHKSHSSMIVYKALSWQFINNIVDHDQLVKWISISTNIY